MGQSYKAHFDEKSGRIQTVKEHGEGTAARCRDFSVEPLKETAYLLGMLHDVGKFLPEFQRRINGENIAVEHSICGAIEASKRYKSALGVLMAYCIAGHHSGLPDGGSAADGEDEPTLQGRLKRQPGDYSAYKEELQLPEIDEDPCIGFFVEGCRTGLEKSIDREQFIDQFSFFTRYVFSCLVDADALDTGIFYGSISERRLQANFGEALKKVNDRLNSFVCKTNLQKSRSKIQEQVFQKISAEAEIYLINMPTGSGKTLTSVKYALEKALLHEKKRVIYIIPFNSIIDQTAKEFEDLFGQEVEILRHQSTFSYEDEENKGEDYKKAAKSAVENWDSPFIITTMVQFFESVYSNKRGKLQKMHNMADSILVFDEAHMMPQKYLQPCLQAVAYITRYLGSKAVFLTATMPDFEKLLKQYALPDSCICDLITDRSSFFCFQKCRYLFMGKVSPERLWEKMQDNASNLVVVNEKKAARELYRSFPGKKYHLSTYMAACDRKRVIEEIRTELKNLEEDFEDLSAVPADRKITVISTSLIEAGIDLDFQAVFRELSGLDSILQAGGRCNREGKRTGAEVGIFELESSASKISTDVKGNLTKGLVEKYEDISCGECIREYYDRLFCIKEKEIQKYVMHERCKDIMSIPFREYAEEFELIDERTVSIVVERDEKSRELISSLRYEGAGSARKLQPYTCSVSRKELDDLYRQHVIEDYGTGIWCLTNTEYYDEDTGILFEANDYIL